MTTGAAEAAQSLLLQELRAEQILTGKDFDERRRVVNAAVDRVPAMIVRPESVDDVATAVRIARRCNLPISVRGGGHDWSGRAIRSSGLVVDMGGMCSVDIEGDVALVAGGATSDHVLAAAREHGLSAALGTVGTVGVVGLILGGGYSTLLGVTGLGVDNLLSAEVVLADGSVVVADADHEAELFWALRGGGGNFGVVTSIRIRLHAIADVYAGTVAFSRAEAQQVLLNLRVLHDTLDDALDVMFGAIHTGDAPVLFTSPVWAGPADEGPAQINRVRSLGTPVSLDVARHSVADLVQSNNASFPPGLNYHVGTRIISGITEDFIDAFLACWDNMPQGCVLNVHHVHGAATRVPADATAHAYRNPHLVVEILGTWQQGDGTAERAWVHASERRLDDVAEPGGWTNLMAPDDPRAEDAYGGNRERLVAAKRQYDPESVFMASGLPH
ncbi:6-hydroxy-D-nicotine oxidase [Mycolicibacterium tokaiense]|uniref:6-hydroxy-D-nicotine oxidase n=2 Tax=Mycolicibacterium tokaiense TaxID=39695 RepID=A0A378TAP0_9MYCO|nr:6-hydroxy-D-nicotine oxidase [Mycolicibacterium tokaiense]STZ56606.1 6-hydroxy-D-nicotine oxidase [Mycolicibacterium tokaiense]